MRDPGQLLKDEDVEVRRSAVLELKEAPPQSAVPLLLKALGDTSWRVRKAAQELLADEGLLELSISGLISLLYLEENAGARNAAIECLVYLGKKATPRLMEAFGSPNRDVRKFIIDIIGEVGDRKALPLLLNALHDEDDNVRASAVEHLGRMGDSSVVDALIEILKTGELWTAFPAADALGRIGDKKAIPALVHALSVKALREPALKGLGHLSAPETLVHIAPFLLDASKSISAEALKTVGVFYHNGVAADFICDTISKCCGEQVIDKLISLAWSNKPEVRTIAILLLGVMRDERALEPLFELYSEPALAVDVRKALVFIGKSKPETLIPFFDSDNPYRRRFVAEVTAEIGSPAYYSIFESLTGDGDGHVRAIAAIGLSRMHEPRAVGPIKKLLYDPYEDVQDAAVSALSVLSEGLDAGELIGFLKDGNPAVRKNAALLLGRIADSRSIGALGFALKDENVSVRKAVIEALSSMGTEESVRYLVFALTDEDRHIRAAAALSLGVIGAKLSEDAAGTAAGDSIFGPLVLLLADVDDSARVSAIRALGIMGDKKAVPQLIGTLTDRNGFIVTTAMEALGKLGGEESKEALIRMLVSDDAEIRRTAVRTLSSFEGIEDKVLPYLNDPDWATRVAAIEALRKNVSGRARTEVEKLFDREEDPEVKKAIKEFLDVR